MIARGWLLAVNGTLMRGLELNGNLVAAGARFVRDRRAARDHVLRRVARLHGGARRTLTRGTPQRPAAWAPRRVMHVLLARATS
jgi:hypothetical protein